MTPSYEYWSTGPYRTELLVAERRVQSIVEPATRRWAPIGMPLLVGDLVVLARRGCLRRRGEGCSSWLSPSQERRWRCNSEGVLLLGRHKRACCVLGMGEGADDDWTEEARCRRRREVIAAGAGAGRKQRPRELRKEVRRRQSRWDPITSGGEREQDSMPPYWIASWSIADRPNQTLCNGIKLWHKWITRQNKRTKQHLRGNRCGGWDLRG